MKRAGKPARVDQGAASRADLHQAAEIHAGTVFKGEINDTLKAKGVLG